MTEIKLTLADPARGCADLLAAAEACGHSSVASHLREMAAQIEEQVKPAIEEPNEWGSVVRAFVCGSDPELWVRTLVGYSSGWTNATSARVNWHALCEPEVLRVGVGPQPLAEWESDLLNEQEVREVAAAVLAAMDVDQYLIDAVVNARPR